MKTLTQIARELRKTLPEVTIVYRLKNRDIPELEKYDCQKNHPLGVTIYAPDEEVGQITFGTTSASYCNSLDQYATKWGRDPQNNFALACYESNSITELAKAFGMVPDKGDCKVWNICGLEWLDAIFAALVELTEIEGETNGS